MSAFAEAVNYHGRIAALNLASIPFYTITQPQVDLPNSTFSVDGVLENITKKGIVRFSTRKHALVELPSPRPHHPKGSKVLWVAEIDGNKNFTRWRKDSWRQLANDREFVDELQNQVVIETAEGHTAYLYFGYVDPSTHKERPHTYPNGMQTLPPTHAHVSDAAFPTIPEPERINLFDAQDLDILERLAFFANIARETAIFYWDALIKDFGKRINFKQPLPTANNGLVRYDRTFFGFPSLQKGISQILWLQEKIGDGWDKFCQQIYENSPIFFHDRLKAQIKFFKQSAVVNAAIMFPSNNDRVDGGVKEDQSPVWIAPFTIASALQMLKGKEIRRPTIIGKAART